MPHQTSRLPPWPGTEYYTAVREFDSALQRIAVHYHLKGLAREELDAYVAYRLKAAELSQPLFDDTAMQALYQATKGILRKVNKLASAALTLRSTISSARTA